MMFPQMVKEYRGYVEQILAMIPDAPTVPEEYLDPIATFMMVTTGGGSIDYVVNSQLGYIGGDFVTYTNTYDEPPADYAGERIGSVTFVKLSASTHEAAMSPRSMDSIAYMQDAVNGYVSSNPGITASWVTGTAVVMYDISEIISGEFTMIEVLVIILIIVLLFFVMRSYTIPIRSVATILMSICWTLAATHLLFGDEVTWLIPLILLVICLGLGMDYDILLTTRIKENVRDR